MHSVKARLFHKTYTYLYMYINVCSICKYINIYFCIHMYASVCKQISTSILANVVAANFLTAERHTRTTS